MWAFCIYCNIQALNIIGFFFLFFLTNPKTIFKKRKRHFEAYTIRQNNQSKTISNANANAKSKFGTQKYKMLYLTFDAPMYKCYFKCYFIIF